MPIDRRSLLTYAAALPLAGALPRSAHAAEVDVAEKADYTLRIATGLVELSPEHIVSTTLYNGQFPGPLVRLTEGKRVVVDIYNDTDTPELSALARPVHAEDVDGAAEEGTPVIRAARHAPHYLRAEALGLPLLPHARRPPAATSTAALTRARRGRFTSSRRTIPAPTIAKCFSCSRSSSRRLAAAATCRWTCWRVAPVKDLKEIGKNAEATIQRAEGLRSRLRVLRASTAGCSARASRSGSARASASSSTCSMPAPAEIRSLALPGHAFHVVALDGNPVPTPADVPVLWLGTAERISAIVEMNRSRRVGPRRPRRRRSRARHGHRRRICRRQGQAAVEQAETV